MQAACERKIFEQCVFDRSVTAECVVGLPLEEQELTVGKWPTLRGFAIRFVQRENP